MLWKIKNYTLLYVLKSILYFTLNEKWHVNHLHFLIIIFEHRFPKPVFCKNEILFIIHFFQKLKYPKAVFFIISNEFCERFAYYGMRSMYLFITPIYIIHLFSSRFSSINLRININMWIFNFWDTELNDVLVLKYFSGFGSLPPWHSSIFWKHIYSDIPYLRNVGIFNTNFWSNVGWFSSWKIQNDFLHQYYLRRGATYARCERYTLAQFWTKVHIF